MTGHWIAWTLAHRWMVLIFTALVCAAGVWAFFQQPIDAYPDISPQVVQVITDFPGRAAEEVERQVTVPIEIALRSVPKVESIRSRTIFGLSDVHLTFEEGTEAYWARQRVLEKLASAQLPDGATAELGPLATAYCEIYRYELRSDGTADLMQLRELNDWVVIPRILRASGVAEVTNFGGLSRQFAVQLQPAQLRRFGLTFAEVVQAVQSNNSVAGGSVLRRGGSSFVIRGTGSLQSIPEIEAIFVKSIGGTPVYLRDVATVGNDYAVRTGIFGKDERDDSVEGIVLMRRGENPSRVLGNVQAAISELNESGLPDGVQVDAFYNRQYLVDSTLGTVSHSISLGVLLVLLVLLLFLGQPTVAFLVAFTIPFSLLFALVLMYFTKIPIGLLSIGAIDFGIIVDGAIIMAEHLATRLKRRQAAVGSVTQAVLTAAQEMERPVFFSVLMVIVAYLPLLSLTRIEGLLFRPMALTMVYALVGSLIFALFIIPVLISLAFKNGYRELANPALDALTAGYAWLVSLLLKMRWLTLAAAVLLVSFVSIRVVPQLGFEFLPYMDEGVIWVRANFPEGTAMEQTNAFAAEIRDIVMSFEDIRFVSSQAGRNDSGTDPFPASRLETMVGPKPHSEWKQFQNKQQLIAALGKRLRDEFPTTRFNFTQPIIDSVTEDTNGTSANLAIEVAGPDPAVLLNIARQGLTVLRSIPGAVDANIEQEGPQPQLVITPDRFLCAQYDVRVGDVTSMINTAIGAEPVGTLYEGERKFDIVTKFDRSVIDSPEALAQLPVFSTRGVAVPLGQVAHIELRDGQTIIARQNGKRRLTVRCDIVGRDQGSFVKEAQQLFSEKVNVPDGYNIAWLGMFENLTRAQNHFLLVMPVTVVLIFGLLLVTFHSAKAALLLLASVPFAFVGAVLGLYVRDMNFNVSTGVGFAALFGVSIMNGVLMIRSIAESQAHGLAKRAAVIDGARNCLRPILLASLVAVLGLLPASLANGLGSDVQRPLATVIVWGLSSAAVLTLFVVPVLYDLISPKITVSTGHTAG
ncbi:efflux RND transporter permease subunit [Planctomicrobium piriforme]|uniref:Cobalt-zinc-cadmium resistance protein CzcA n=1 Tax=Planctomicrobium piriforme TaxID=1576369 RepID=A0A1I3FY71_9PLAN|nr:CusA/CzcA family heavy metal efflux RND transporter [Planctomicrobium piriforme]SFI16135.1 cobalt-zinc-cadmium resistance protein CzcA [Planctomicrobium piriforme]